MKRLVSIPLALFCFGNVATAQSFTQMVAFGDSLSDVGNVSNATFGISPGSGYFSGRYSNGPVWVEDLASLVGVPTPTFSRGGGRDYAYGGVKTGSGNTSYFPFSFPNVGTQITQYLGSETPGSSILFTVWGGANNFLGHLSQDPGVVVNNLVSHVTTLNNAGARFIVVPNLPPLGLTPRYHGTADEAAYNNLINDFNTQLRTAMTTLDAQLPAKIYQLDVGAAMTDIVANPANYGLTNVTQPAMNLNPPNPDEFLFWDDVHPTRAGHDLLAKAAFDLVTTHTWLGADGTWSDASNWDVADVPAAAWIAAIDNRGTSSFAVTVASSSAVRRVLAAGTTAPVTLRVVGGAGLNASQTITVDAGATMQVRENASVAAASIDLQSGATLLGGGNVSSVRSAGVIQPAADNDAVGRLTVNGDLVQTAGGELRMDLTDTSGVGDQVDVSGTASLAGNLRILAVGTPLPGNSYDVVTFASGSGSVAIANDTGLPGLRFAQSLLPTSLRVTLSGGPGDANLDGIVNIADFSSLSAHFNQAGNWLDGDFDFSQTVGVADFSLLAANFNQMAPRGTPAVPEPAMSALAMLAAFAWRRRP